ncbi:MAG: hypothetical protein WBB72_00505, partial [Methyloceanibacter sp.]
PKEVKNDACMRYFHGLGLQCSAQSSLYLAFADCRGGFAQGQGPPKKDRPRHLSFSGTGMD